jgi:hypothetical protein
LGKGIYNFGELVCSTNPCCHCRLSQFVRPHSTCFPNPPGPSFLPVRRS